MGRVHESLTVTVEQFRSDIAASPASGWAGPVKTVYRHDDAADAGDAVRVIRREVAVPRHRDVGEAESNDVLAVDCR